LMRILVTGGAGFIGTHIVFELMQLNVSVCVVDDLSNAWMDNLKKIQSLFPDKVGFIKGNICDSKFLNEVFESFKPEFVIHLAGLKYVNESIDFPLTYYQQNFSGALAVLNAMEKVGTKKILFSSSASVYGAVDALTISEGQHCNPMQPYARSKYFVERMILDWSLATTNSSAVILRYFNPIGAHGSHLIGDNPKNNCKNALSIFIDCALEKTNKIHIFGDDYDTPDGTCIRDYLHVEDLAKGHLKSLEYMGRNKGTEIINLGTGKGASVLELVSALEAVSNKSIPYEVQSKREGEIPYSVADAKKAKILLGWETEKSLKQMCSDAWLWSNRLANASR
jgi:UDP-glucose 4-epimerase